MKRPTLEALAVALALAGLVVWSFAQRWAVLASSPFPVGIDGYFYPIQLRALLEDGSLAYPASPLTFWLMAPFAAATDPITGAKLGAALFGALIALPAYGVGAHLGRSRGAGLVCATLVTTSAGSMFLTFEFVKNGVGLTVGLTAIWLVLRALAVPSRGRIVGAVLAIAAALLAHKLAAALVLALALPAALVEARARGALQARVLVAIAALALTAIVLGLAFPARFLSPDDAALLARTWTRDARWDAPALVRPGTTLTMGHEALLAGIAAVLAAAALVGRGAQLWAALTAIARPISALLARAERTATAAAPSPLPPGARAVAWGFVALALLVALPWLDVTDAMGLGFRLRLVAFVPLAGCAAIAAPPLANAIASVLAEAPTIVRLATVATFALVLALTVPPTLALCIAGPLVLAALALSLGATASTARELVLATVAACVLLAMPRDRTAGKMVVHPAMVAAVQGLTPHVPARTTLIVPERQVMFMVAWYTRAPARLHPDRVPHAQRARVMPLAFIGLDSPLDTALMSARTEPSLAPPIGTHPRHPNGLVLVREPTWDWLLDHLPPDARAYFASWPTI